MEKKLKSISRNNLNSLVKLTLNSIQNHSSRVSKHTNFILSILKDDEKFASEGINPSFIEEASLYHDIGKSKIETSSSFLIQCHSQKAKEEYYSHADRGLEALLEKGHVKFENYSENSFEKVLYKVVYEHHENYDGSGFPKNKVGENISIGARVVRIADELDNILFFSKKRPTALGTCNIIISGKGTKFDTHIVEVLEGRAKEFIGYIDSCLKDPVIKEENNKTGLILNYQEVRDIRSNETSFFVMDYYLQDPLFGKLDSEVFRIAAEQKKKIVQLERVAFESLCIDVRKLRRKGYVVPAVVVPLSYDSALSKSYIKGLASIIKKNGIPPKQFIFAIPEVDCQEMMEILVGVIGEINKIEMKFAISSFNDKISLLIDKNIGNHVDYVIFDKRYSYEMLENQMVYNAISGLTKTCLSIGAEVVFSKVENRKTEENLLKFGVKYAYGSLYSRPLAISSFAKKLVKEELEEETENEAKEDDDNE